MAFEHEVLWWIHIEAARRIDWNLVLDQLDERRRVVLKCTAEGYGTDEIASALKVSSPRVCRCVREP